MAETNNYPLFISFERRDSGGWSLFLYEQLAARFGEGVVFRDSQEIRAGERWKVSLRRHVSECRGFILIIGPEWCEPRVLEKLRDPEGWVRKEIETAIGQGKEVFPVLVGGAVAPPLDQLPEAIRLALHDFNHFHFHDGPAWQRDLDRVCADIEERTGLVRPARAVSAAVKLYDRVLARLDRNRQIGHLRRAFADGGQLFLASGVRKGGFHHFAIRCALDVLRTQGVDDGERIVALNWSLFFDPEGEEERRVALLRNIAEALLTESGMQDPRRLLERIAQAVRQTRRATVIYSTVTAGSRLDSDLAEEWCACWREIFRLGPSRRVILILFVEQGWWPLSARAPVRTECCDSAIRPTLGVVCRKDLRQWLDSDLRNYADGGLWSKINRQCERLFRWRRGRHFDDIGDVVIAAWLSTGRG